MNATQALNELKVILSGPGHPFVALGITAQRQTKGKRDSIVIRRTGKQIGKAEVKETDGNLCYVLAGTEKRKTTIPLDNPKVAAIWLEENVS